MYYKLDSFSTKNYGKHFYKLGQFIITIWNKCCYKLGQLLQIRANFISKKGSYYKIETISLTNCSS